MKTLRFIGFLAVMLSVLVACNNQTSSIGLGLAEQLEVHDPVFGDCRASTYAQFNLTGSSVNFGANPVVDSIVLTLQLASYYGDTNSRVGLRVYQLTEPLSGTYNSASTVNYDPTPLNYALTGYAIQPTTSVVVDTGNYSPHLRIRLSNAFGQYLLNNQHHMTSNAAFKSFFHGLCISAVSHTGPVGYILLTSMNSSLSGITLYYHNEVPSNTPSPARRIAPVSPTLTTTTTPPPMRISSKRCCRATGLSGPASCSCKPPAA